MAGCLSVDVLETDGCAHAYGVKKVKFGDPSDACTECIDEYDSYGMTACRSWCVGSCGFVVSLVV